MPNTVLHTRRKALQEKLLHKISEYDYRFIRYKANYSVAVFFTPEGIDLKPLGTYIRATDRFAPLDENFYVVVFDGANDDKGLKAANNLLTYFQHAHFGRSLFAGIVTADHSKNAPQMIAQLFDLLDYALRHNMDNHIVDDSQIMKTV